MSRPPIDFPPEEPSLSSDLSRLSSLLDRVIRGLEGESTAESIAACRRASAERQAPSPQISADVLAPNDERSRLESFLIGREPLESEILCRAFVCHLHLIELAKQNHSVRRSRQAESPADPSDPLTAALLRLQSEHRSSDSVSGAFTSLAYAPALTVHPCRVSSPSRLELDRRILRLLTEPLSAGETDNEARLLEAITDLWRSTPFVTARPTTREQREHVLFLLTESVYPACPDIVDRLDRAWRSACDPTPNRDDEAQSPVKGSPAPPSLRWGSWIGGDMDANPYVTADTLKSSLAFNREAVLTLYSRDLKQVAEQIATQAANGSTSLVKGLDDGLEEVLEEVRAISERVDRARSASDPDADVYRHPNELAADLASVRKALESADPEAPATRSIRHLERRFETFGFHFASLYQRQDSALHRNVLGQLMLDDRWAERPASSRVRRLRQMIPKATRRGAPPGSPAYVHQTLAVFRALQDSRQKGIEDRASGPFVVSLTEGPDDLLSVLLLARWGGLIADGQVPLDVAPLFETVSDLEKAPRILDELLGLEVYRRHLSFRGNRQTVMLAFDDVNKDSGFFASRWSLRKAQSAMLEAASKHSGVELVFLFDRSDSISEQPEPSGALSPHLSMTEPGMTLSDRFLVPELVGQTVESTLALGLRRALPRRGPSSAEVRAEPWRRLADTAAQGARESYRDLIYGERKFYRYYRLATPVDVIERLMIGSRTSSRRTHAGVANLRATPWMLAWILSRHMVPNWFGLGSGLQRAIDVHGTEPVTDAVRSWPFLAALLTRAERALAWSDLEIAERFSRLAGDLGPRIFPRIAQEHRLTLELLRRLQGSDPLASADTAMGRAIEQRRPYIDSASFLQVDLLRRWRESSREDDQLLKALLASVGGICQGLKGIF